MMSKYEQLFQTLVAQFKINIYRLQAYLVSLCFVDIAFFKQIEGLWHPCIEKVYWHHFPNNICSLHVSVSCFGNSPNISNPLAAKRLQFTEGSDDG